MKKAMRPPSRVHLVIQTAWLSERGVHCISDFNDKFLKLKFLIFGQYLIIQNMGIHKMAMSIVAMLNIYMATTSD